MERLVVLIGASAVSHQDVMEVLRMSGASTSDREYLPLREARARFERDYILERLAANAGSLADTARQLGIERTNLYRKMKQLGIPSRPARLRK
jgi:two-component system, NtrC family, nitrogen regulation response regulator NtrX